MIKKMANKITYFFDNNKVKQAFEACIDVIERELSTSQSINLNEICTISEEEHSDDEYVDDEIFVETHNIQEIIYFFLNEFEIDPRKFYLSDDDIKNRYEYVIEDEIERSDFSISIEKNTNLDTLFNVLYARSISLESVVQYEDFDYQEFFDAIESLKPAKIDEIKYEFKITR